MSSNSIHLIGGGIIGLCSAWYLREEGFDVTVIERGNFSSEGTSYGNAGMLVPSHFVPMASPGMIKKGLLWMLSSSSPFYIRPRPQLELFRWLWQFYRSANPAHVARCAPTLLEFNTWSKELYYAFSQLPAFSEIGYEERGLLMLYKTAQQEAEEQALAQHAQQLGLSAETLRPDQVRELEPDLELDIRGGLYFRDDAHLSPGQFMFQLYKALQQRGVKFLTNQRVEDFKVSGDQVKAVVNDTGQAIPVNNLLLTAGCWSAKLVRKLKLSLLLQAGKGYSFTIDAPRSTLRIPTILAEAKVAITPMGSKLRIGGTLELGTPSTRVSQSRLDGILASLPKYYQNLDISGASHAPIWQGYRPCTPDGMPYIGRSKRWKNLSIATGHGMMGMSLGPASGKLVAQLLTHQPTTIDLKEFDPGRFGSF